MFWENVVYYISCIVAVLIGLFLIKRIVSCLFRIVITIILVAILGYCYFQVQ